VTGLYDLRVQLPVQSEGFDLPGHHGQTDLSKAV
jgi:hypothetical protein